MAKTKEIEDRNGEPAGAASFDPTGDEPKIGRRQKRAIAKQQKAEAKKDGRAKKAAAEEAEQDEAIEESAPAPPAPARDFRRIGHKGADAIVTGNTIASFEAAVEAGAEIIEFDVLRTREGRLIVAHDYHDAGRRRPLDLHQALSAFNAAPLDEVEIDCDLKLPGREAELAGALAGHHMIDRAMVSTMEIESLIKLRTLEPELRLGWTFPKTRRDWSKERWAKPVMGAGLALMRRRLPGLIADRAPKLELDSVWAYHWLVTTEAVAAAEEAGVELYAWTVDDPKRVNELADLGVHGIVSNDPRILT